MNIHLSADAQHLYLNSPHSALVFNRKHDHLSYQIDYHTFVIDLDNTQELVETCQGILQEDYRKGSGQTITRQFSAQLQEQLENELIPFYDNWLPTEAQRIRALQYALRNCTTDLKLNKKQFPITWGLENKQPLSSEILENPAIAYAYLSTSLSGHESREAIWEYYVATDAIPDHAHNHRETVQNIRQPLDSHVLKRLRDTPLDRPVSDVQELTLRVELWENWEARNWREKDKDIGERLPTLPYTPLKRAQELIHERLNRSQYNRSHGECQVLLDLLLEQEDMPIDEYVAQRLNTPLAREQRNRAQRLTYQLHDGHTLDALPDFQNQHIQSVNSMDTVIALSHDLQIIVSADAVATQVHVLHTRYKGDEALSVINRYGLTFHQIYVRGPFGMENYATRYSRRILEKHIRDHGL